MIHACLEQAVNSNYIYKNPSNATSLPKGSVGKKRRALSKDEMQIFLEAVARERLEAAFVVLLGTGIRLGELLGLHWSDIDLKNSTLSVTQSLNRLKSLDKNAPTKTQLIFQEPKTEGSKRNIPLPSKVVEAPYAHKARQEEEKSAAEDIYSNQDLAFCTNIGMPIDPRNPIRDIHRISKNAGLETVNVHSLRHTYATRLLEANQHPKVVQELLGHANISMTLDAYSHVMPDVKKEAVKTLDLLFEPEENPVKND